jgi:uncharacterized protein (TIGR02453 family)
VGSQGCGCRRARAIVIPVMPNASYFTPELFAFLKDLKANNTRPWFAANRERYETALRQPFLRFIGDFAPRLHDISPCFRADASPAGGSLFRIHRDVRFSRDKSPYKTHAGAHFPHTGAAAGAHAPGFYLHLDPDACFTAAGSWQPGSAALGQIRDAIVARPAEWKRVRDQLEIGGESLIRPPKGYDPEHPFIEDLKRKDFVTSLRFSEKQVCGPGFLAEFAATCRRMAPLVEFVTRALGLAW